MSADPAAPRHPEGGPASDPRHRAPSAGSLPDALLAEVVRQHSEGFVVLDDTATVVFANGSAAVVGWSPADLVGRSAFDFIAPEDLERAAVTMSAVQATDRPSPGLINLVGADGVTREFEASPGLLTAADGRTYTFVSIHDDRLNNAHWTALASLVAGDPLATALGHLATGASHPVDGPMSVTFDELGRRHHTGVLPAPLAGVQDGRADERPDSPFGRALGGDIVVVPHLDQLPADLVSLAAGEGLGSCVVIPVPDPAEARPAFIVQWPPSPEMAQVLATALARRPRQLVALALRQRHQQRRLEWLALHDELTGLPNRSRFFTALDDMACDEGGIVGYVDLDGFKDVNDTHGHVAGDAVLVECAERLRGVMRDQDLVARLGGDELAVLCPGPADEDDLHGLGERLVDALRSGWSFDGQELAISASVGLATLTRGGDAEQAIAAADQALYRAKTDGKARWRSAPAAH